MTDDFFLQSYDFPLPKEAIAQEPTQERGTSRLLVTGRNENSPIVHTTFADIATYLPKDALLVANDSRVLAARLKGRRPTGGAIEFLLLTPLPILLENARQDPNRPGWMSAHAEGLFHANSRAHLNETFSFDPKLNITIEKNGPFGQKEVLLAWRGDLTELFARIGHIPLPPYIKREDTKEDALRYQTVYADPEKNGSVAAPTAGLHFTEEIRQKILRSGFGWTQVTLYVGYGTFSPIRCEDIRDHTMHREFLEISPQAATTINHALSTGRPIVAIGTTSARALEGVYAALGKIAPFRGTTDIFLYPGKSFHVIQGLLTNFHLPKSSLVLLVAAFAGREHILSCYREAIARGYRFFSYGDCMLIRDE